MEDFVMNVENKNSKMFENLGQNFDESEYEKQLSGITIEKNLAREDAKIRADLKLKLFESEDKREKVQEFVRNNCSEPIKGVDKIVPFNELVQLLIKSAEDENLPEVKESIEKGNAKDKRIYELPVYKQLIEKGFILPSDLRTYYDSADRKPVYHLGVDYNVKAGTEVKSMYDGKVVESGLDGGLGHKVIIEHTMSDGTKFYSLYGHLGSGGLPGIGDEVKKGMKIGEVGKPFTEENGDWEEHLHFQIMENIDSDRGYYELKENELKEKEKRIGRKLKDEEKVKFVMGETRNYDVLESFGKE